MLKQPYWKYILDKVIFIIKGDSFEPPFISLIINQSFYTIPCAIIAFATFMKPAILAPFT